MPAVKK